MALLCEILKVQFRWRGGEVVNITFERLWQLVQQGPATGKFLLTETAFLAVRKIRDADGAYIWSLICAEATVLGRPYELVDPSHDALWTGAQLAFVAPPLDSA